MNIMQFVADEERCYGDIWIVVAHLGQERTHEDLNSVEISLGAEVVLVRKDSEEVPDLFGWGLAFHWG